MAVMRSLWRRKLPEGQSCKLYFSSNIHLIFLCSHKEILERKCALVFISHSLVSLMFCKRTFLASSARSDMLLLFCIRSLGRGFFTHAWLKTKQLRKCYNCGQIWILRSSVGRDTYNVLRMVRLHQDPQGEFKAQWGTVSCPGRWFEQAPSIFL